MEASQHTPPGPAPSHAVRIMPGGPDAAYRPVRLRGTENRHKPIQKSHAKIGLLDGLPPPFAEAYQAWRAKLLVIARDWRQTKNQWVASCKSPMRNLLFMR